MTTTNATTRAIIDYLNMNGFVAYRNNNGAVYSVKRNCFLKNPLHKAGIPDICGYRKSDGRALFVEIKTGKDKLSLEQADFMRDAKKSGCIAFITGSTENAIARIDQENLLTK